jgi:hypothetical protein
LLSIDPPVGVGFLGSFRQHMGFFPHLQFAGRRFFRRVRSQAMDLNRRDAVKFGR